MDFTFQDITQHCINLIVNAQDPIVNKIYSNFNFLYYPYQYLFEKYHNYTILITHLLNFLKEYKFITYKYCKLPELLLFSKKIDNSNQKSDVSVFQDENNNVNTDAIICVEKCCLIIEKIDISVLNDILNDTKSSLINYNSGQNNQHLNRQLLIKNIFDKNFQKDIKNNTFISLTILPIVGYMINRYFYPTNYFKDQSFFRFDKIIDSKEKKIRDLKDLLIKTDKNYQQEIISKIQSINDEIQPKVNNYEFKIDDFIDLNYIYSDNKDFMIKLVIHRESLFLFAIKYLYRPVKDFESNHEIYFCQNFSHQCFVRFYGFLKNKKGEINGFVYDFMSNGDLLRYINSTKDNISDAFSLMIMIRIYEGLQYLHSNNLIHRDIKPSNILLNNDLIPFISDFETIRSIDQDDNSNLDSFTFSFGSPIYASPEQAGKFLSNISFTTDIFSFGATIYFLFEKKEMDEINISNNFSQMINASENIQSIYKSCVKYKPEGRMKLDSIGKMINIEFQSFSYLEKYLIDENSNKMTAMIEQYFLEIILFKNNDLDTLHKLINNIFIFHTLYEYSFQNKSILFLKLGNHYQNGIYLEQNIDKALINYEKSFKLGNADAAFILGNLYFEGKYVKKDYSKVIYYYEISAKNNNSNALFNLGSFYLTNQEVKKDYGKAIKYYILAADLKNPYAAFLLGFFYSSGTAVSVDYMKSIKYLQFASQKNLSVSSLCLGFLYLDQHDFLNADHYFELFLYQRNDDSINNHDNKLLFHGLRNHISFCRHFIDLLLMLDEDCIYNIGVFYFKFYVNYLKSIKYFEFAAELNNLDANKALVYIYYNGIGVNPDILKVIRYLELAANRNDSESLYNLGIFYFYGIGVKQDYLKSIKYLELSYNLKNSDAMFLLGTIYLYGLGVEKDYTKSIYYLELSSNLFNPCASNNLGFMYLSGLGVKQNYEKARKYFELSAKHNFSLAYANLGVIYENGFGVKHDYPKAKYYYELAAQQNDLFAFYSLGKLYYEGKYFAKNLTKSIECFKKSAQQGNPIAYLMLGFIFYTEDFAQNDIKKALTFFEKAAQLRNTQAILCLGFYYMYNESDFKKSLDYFEMAANQGNIIAFFQLGELYSNGIYIEINYNKAIYCFLKCIEGQTQEISFSSLKEYGFAYLSKNRYIYYIANNNLGLIYLTVYQDHNKAKEYIQKAGLNEYPFGQNNLGLLYQFYFNNIKNAEYLYQKASENNFALADFNLGKLKEKQGKIKESIDFYVNASKKADNLLIFQQNDIDDERLTVSKLFIISLTNLKLIKYFYSNNESQSEIYQAKEYFLKLIEELIKHSDDNNYKFHFQYNCKQNDNLTEYTEYFLINFILNFPMFNISKEEFISINMLNESEDSVRNYIDQNSTESNANKNEYSTDFASEYKSHYENIKNLAKQEIIKNQCNIDYFCKEDQLIFDNSELFYDYFCQNKDLRIIFIRCIQKAIEIMEKIIYTPPYQILFGRILTKNCKLHLPRSNNNLAQPINNFFYEGLGEIL